MIIPAFIRSGGPFINYFKHDVRDSPLNVSMARVLFGTYLLWKFTTMVPWQSVQEWPVYVTSYDFPIPLWVMLKILPVEQYVVVAMLVGFIVGYRIGLCGFVAALLIAHMSLILHMVTNSGTSTTFLPPVYLLVLFAVFRRTDHLSIDKFRGQRSARLQELVRRLKSSSDRVYSMSVLKWILLTTGSFYFLTGFHKILYGFKWVDGANLRRYLQIAIVDRGKPLPLARFIIEQPLLAEISAWSSVGLEVGFVFAILAGVSITPLVVGLIGFHAIVSLAMTPNFFDQYILFSLFLPWDKINKKLSSTDKIEVVFDEKCHFCTRSLLLIDILDLNDVLSFYSQSDLPEQLAATELEFDEAMYAFVDGTPHRGYQAFAVIFRSFGFTRPVAWFMCLPGIDAIGERLYGYVASNRGRYFRCEA